MKTLPILFCLLLNGCSYLSVGTGYATSIPFTGHNNPWQGTQPAVIARLTLPVARGVSCEYTHVSNLFTGPPFNDDKESTLDFFGCLFKVKP